MSKARVAAVAVSVVLSACTTYQPPPAEPAAPAEVVEEVGTESDTLQHSISTRQGRGRPRGRARDPEARRRERVPEYCEGPSSELGDDRLRLADPLEHAFDNRNSL